MRACQPRHGRAPDTAVRRGLGAAVRLAFCGLLAGAAPAWAQEEDEEFAELLEVLSEETEVATRTRMNSDFVPGIVTVLDARKMQALGARTVWDALSFVPGVEAWRDNNGTPTVNVRGIPFPFNTGSVQVLVDGIPIAAEAAGLNGAALLMPVEMVERIEFVRGPGSVIYGDYAFQGLLNVITREQDSRVDVAVGTHDRRSASARLAGDAAGFRYVLQAAGFGAGDAPTPVGRTAEEDRRFYTLHVQRAALSLQINAVGRDLEGSQPVNPLSFDESSTGAELRHDRAWSEDFSTRLRLQHLSNEVLTPGISFDGGHREAGAEFLWSGFANQTWLAGFEYNEARIDRATQRLQAPPNRPPPPPLVFTGLEREAHGAFVQGQFTLAERWQATLGARYDDNETVGSRFTPRASLVWRLHDNHILKAQYAEGFRSPTFFEVYTVPTQPMLDYEVNRTGEINYVYQQGQTTARVTLFRSRIDDMVFRNFGGAPGFGNIASAESEGVELEFSRQLGADWRIDSALAWVDSRDDRNPTLSARDIGAAADWFGNLGLLWTPDADSVFGLRWTHVGERSSALPADADYDRVDLSWTRRNFVAPGLELQLLVQNATGAEHVYFNPSPMVDLPVRYDERTAWMRLGWEW